MSLKSLLGYVDHLFVILSLSFSSFSFSNITLLTRVISSSTLYILGTWRKTSHMVPLVVFTTSEISSWRRIRFSSLFFTFDFVHALLSQTFFHFISDFVFEVFSSMYVDGVDHILYGSHIFSCSTVMFAAVFHCQKCWVISFSEMHCVFSSTRNCFIIVTFAGICLWDSYFVISWHVLTVAWLLEQLIIAFSMYAYRCTQKIWWDGNNTSCEGWTMHTHTLFFHHDILVIAIQYFLSLSSFLKVSPESASEFGELVADPITNELLHYTEKPETFVCSCAYVLNCWTESLKFFPLFLAAVYCLMLPAYLNAGKWPYKLRCVYIYTRCLYCHWGCFYSAERQRSVKYWTMYLISKC